MRRVVIVLVVVLALAVVADFGFRAYAEAKFAEDIQRGLQLQEEPDLALSGFPFALAMARGRLSSAEVDAGGVTYDGLRIDSFELNLEDVRFSAGQILSGRAGTIRAGSGDASADVTQEDMTAYLMFKGYPGRIRFGDGVATVEAEFIGIPISATGPLEVRDGDIVFEPDEVDAGGMQFPVDQVRFAFELERPFEGFTYTGVEVREGTATLQGSIEAAVIPIEQQESGE